MKSTTKTLTEGPLAKQILLVSLPLALSNLLQVLFTVQQIIGCGDETILAAGTVDYIGFSYYMTNAVRADAAATNGEDLG